MRASLPLHLIAAELLNSSSVARERARNLGIGITNEASILPYCVNLGFLGFSKPLREDHLKLERHFLHKPLFLFFFLYLERVVHSWEERENRQTYILYFLLLLYRYITTAYVIFSSSSFSAAHIVFPFRCYAINVIRAITCIIVMKENKVSNDNKKRLVRNYYNGDTSSPRGAGY